MESAIEVRARLLTRMEEVRELGRWRELIGGAGAIRLALPGLTREESEHWESTLTRYASGCGCAEGQVFTVLFLTGYLGSVVFERGIGAVGWWELATAFGFACIGAVVGKGIGLARVRWRLRKAIRQLGVRLAGRREGSPLSAG